MLHPIHTLKHEHRVIESGLRALEGLSLRFSSGQRVPSEAMLQLLDFIRTFADRYHHGKEETHFFPALERRGIPRDSGFLAAMMQQHQIERELVAELSLAMEECAAGDPEANVRFAAVARQFIELLVEHIEKEDQILFRLAEEILDEADKAELGRAFEGAESELAGGLEKYERIAAELEKTWAV